MNSKRFVWGIVSIIVGIVAGVYALAWFWPECHYMTGGEYGSWMQQRDYVQQKHAQQEVLLLGDSRMKIDVDPMEFRSDVYNLALSGASPIDMYYALCSYLTYNEKPKAVLIGFAPTHFMHMENYTQRGLYFHYYSDDVIKEINENILKYDQIDYHSEALKYKYRSPAIYLTGILHSIKSDRQYDNQQSYARMCSQKGGMFLDGSKSSYDQVCPEEIKEREFKPLKSLDYYLRETITLCKSRHIPVYIEQLPMGEYGHDKLLATGYLRQLHEYMTELQEEYEIPVVIDIPVYSNEYFADDSHLNKLGNQKFTEYLQEKYSKKI